MEKYERVQKPKADTPIAENEIRITSKGMARNYITYAMTLLQEKGSNEVIVKAMGRAINKSVTIVELIKRRVPGLHQITSIGSTDIVDTWEPKEEGLQTLETTRHVSMITITLSKEELNTSSVGYQLPIPLEMVKPLAEIDYEGREGSPRGRGGRARGGRGRGRGGRGGNGYVNVEYDDGGRGRGGRGSGYVNNEYDDGGRGRGGRGNGYVNNEYDDGGMEQDQSYGRGRGRVRGGRRGGRGRGYNGPPHHYEAQHDGGDYGNNAPPQDHGYDGPPPQGRGGRGRGGRGGRGRGGGRGGFNRSNGPPIQAAA